LKITSGKCPLSQKESTPSITVAHTREVAFADAASKTAFDTSPDKFIREVRQ